MPADVVLVTYATPAFACVMLNWNFVPEADGFTRVHVPLAPSYIANQIGVWSTVQNSNEVLPLPPAAGFTVKASVVVCSVSPVAFPWIVTVAAPVAAVADAVSVKVEELVVGAVGSNTGATPLGTPVAVSVTAPAKPPDRVMVTVDVPPVPC